MKEAIKFFKHPYGFFNEILEGKFHKYAFTIFIVHVCLYLVWSFQIESQNKVLKYLFSNNKALEIIASLFLNITFIIILAIILFAIGTMFRLHIRFSDILGGLFSIQLIAVLFMAGQIIALPFFDVMKYYYLLGLLCGVLQFCYLFFFMKIVFGKSVIKTIALQIMSFILLSIILALIVYISFQSFIKNDLNKAIAYMQESDYEKAIEELESLIDKHPNNADFYYYLGKAYSRILMGDHERYIAENDKYVSELFKKAEKAYIESLELDPKLLDARIALGILYDLVNRHEKAIEQFSTAIESGLEDNFVYKRMASIYLAMGDVDLAKTYYDKISDSQLPLIPTKRTFNLIINDALDVYQGKDRQITTTMDWRITDKMFFDLSIGTVKKAEEIIKEETISQIRNRMAVDCKETLQTLFSNSSAKGNLVTAINEIMISKKTGLEVINLKWEIRE